MKLSRAALAAVVVLSAAAAGCKRGADADNGAGDAAQVDTTNNDALDGSSTRQVEAEAKAMTPEEAARAGLVDSTTHIENLGSTDSTPPGTVPGANPGATGANAATTRDTVPPAPETKP